MRRIRLDLSYDGSGFCGWQIQARGRTVQGVVEEALSDLLKETVRVIGAGRTDSGVHAERQSCHFDTQNESLPADKFAPALNRFLPPDIRILESRAADSRFHARFSATERVYRYRFYPGFPAPPLWDRCSLPLKRALSAERLNRLAAVFVGTHDFTAFCSASDRSRSKVRTVSRAFFFEQPPFLVFEIAGNAFLWNMVRSVVGTVLSEYDNENAEEKIRGLLEKGNRSGCGATAPARGLSLIRVNYDEEE